MRILYFDCFNGASGDMILGALLDAGLPLDALRERAGQPRDRGLRRDRRARAPRRRVGNEVPARRAWRPGGRCAPARCTRTTRTTTITRTLAAAPRSTHPSHHHDHPPSQPARDLRAHRSIGPDRRRENSRQGAVRAAGGRRGGDPSDAGRARPPSRGRRARLDRGHRRRRLRARLVQARSRGRLAAERRPRDGALGARCVSRARAGDREPPRRRADFLARPRSGTADADRSAPTDRLRGRVRADPADADFSQGIWRRRAGFQGDAQRACAFWSATLRPTLTP